MIETKRLVIRKFKLSDAAACSFNSMQPSAARWLGDMVFQTEEKARGWICWINGKSEGSVIPLQVLAIERKSDGFCIGLVGVGPKKEIDNEVEILYLVADPYQAQGYATEAAKAIIWWAFEQAELKMLSAIVQPENKASLNIIKKCGFQYVDTRELMHDGKIVPFLYHRLYHIEKIPNPNWDFSATYEEMGAFFDRRADGYEAHMAAGCGLESYGRGIAAIAPGSAPLKVLDIGCGTGIELKHLFSRLPNAQVTGIDLSEGMLSILRENYSDKGEQIELIKDSYVTWAYPGETYDYVIAFYTMHHFEEDRKTKIFRSILRTLKPGGQYIETDFLVDEAMMNQHLARYHRIVDEMGEGGSNGALHIDIPFTVELECRLLRDAGFAEVSVLYEDIKPEGSNAAIVAVK